MTFTPKCWNFVGNIHALLYISNKKILQLLVACCKILWCGKFIETTWLLVYSFISTRKVMSFIYNTCLAWVYSYIMCYLFISYKCSITIWCNLYIYYIKIKMLMDMDTPLHIWLWQICCLIINTLINCFAYEKR